MLGDQHPACPLAPATYRFSRAVHGVVKLPLVRTGWVPPFCCHVNEIGKHVCKCLLLWRHSQRSPTGTKCALTVHRVASSSDSSPQCSLSRVPRFLIFRRADWDRSLAAWVATSEAQPDFAVQAGRSIYGKRATPRETPRRRNGQQPRGNSPVANHTTSAVKPIQLRRQP